MKEATTSAAVVPAAIVEAAWQEVGASFERFCRTAAIATLAHRMDEDAARLCGLRYGRAKSKAGHRWGATKGKVGFHGGKVEIERPACAPVKAARSPCRAGRRPSPRTCSASGR
jgi:putative transposase